MPNYIAIIFVFCYNIEKERTLNIVIHVRSFGLLQQFSELVHHVGFMLHKGVGIAVERDGRIFVTEDLGERFYVHAAFECASGKCVTQGMKALVQNIQFFQEQFKTSLVGADGHRLSVCRHHEGRIALFLYAFEDRQQLLRQRYHAARSCCFRLVDYKPVFAVMA